MRRLLAAIIWCLALTGCLVGPNYHRPKVETPQGWRFSEKDARDLADTDWWQQFGDPVLNDLIATALRENKDLLIAAARVEESRSRLAIVRSPLFPQVNAGASAGGERITQRGQTPLSASAANPTALYQANVSASWELDLWGKVRRSTESARADLLASEEGKRGVILSLVAEVAAAYVNLLDLDRQLEIATRTAKSREEYYRIFTLRFNAGYVSNLELSQVRSEYEGALATIPAIEKEISQQEDALSLLLGNNPGAIRRGSSIDTLGIPAVPAGLPSQLLERRPDIRQAEQQLISANAQIGAARAQFFPSISLTGLFGWESTNLAQLFTGPARMWSFAAPVTQPIFNAGAISGGVKVAEAAREEALYNYQKVIQSGFRDVEDSLIDQRRSREQLAAQTGQVEALRLYASTARLRYENGYTSYIEVLDAERSLFDAELGAARTKGVLLQALINLYKAMGGGWVERAETMSRQRR
ncbi:MAG TPA: efflux transporter outer membrane subunit [Geomonas sp.]|nr:efflux transporter outer membrane subunit [Geomonas sp.]